MSLTSTSYSSDETIKINLIDKILEQGQRLRNSMVQSILDHDPFNTDVINSAKTRSLIKSRLRKRVPTQYGVSNSDTLDIEKEKLNAFLKGDLMNRRDEIEALEALRSMSGEDLCQTTNLAYNFSHSKCSCVTCLTYAKEDLSCDLKRSSKMCCQNYGEDEKKKPELTVHAVHPEVNKYMEYVDCMQITIHDLILNERGNKKVNASLSNDKKIPVWGSQTFFIEYEIPFILSVSTHRKHVTRSISSIKNNNFVRICARRLSTAAIPFKQTSMHNIKNVDQINLAGIQMKFQISCRTMKQKNVTPLGYAIFNFARFESSPTLSCIEELSVNFNDNVPIVLGSLRVALQMGCGRLYFGKEFIASIGTSKSAIVTKVRADEIHELNETFSESLPKTISDEGPQRKVSHLTKQLEHFPITSKKAQKNNEDKFVIVQQKLPEKTDANITSTKYETHRAEILKPPYLETVQEYEKRILIGFLYIPEAQYLNATINSFITCRPFCQEDKSYSKLVPNESNPIFNFCQLVPLVYQDDLLQQFRNNVMVIEVWEKFETKDILFGSTKLDLHQFYVCYRNSELTKYLANNKLPVISYDWWEAITNPYTDEIVGQLQILLALGTEQQIHNLELERGFKVQTVRANFEAPFKSVSAQTNVRTLTERGKNRFITGTSNKDKIPQAKHTEKVNFKRGIEPPKPKPKFNKNFEKVAATTEDKGVQSDIDMNSDETKKGKDLSNEKLGQLLNHIITMQSQRSTLVETGTNTDNEQIELNANTLESEQKKTDELHNITDGSMLPTSSARTFETESTSFSSSKQYEHAPPLVRSTSDLLNTLQAALSLPPAKRPLISANRAAVQDNERKVLFKHIRSSFKAQISINQALHLPVRKKCKVKKSRGKAGKGDDSVNPSSYVTFETMPGLDLKMTPLVPKSTSPNWNYKCDVFLPAELLLNNQKRLIFKVWRKSTNTTMVPNLQSDLILGFAAIDLTVLLSGFPNIQGWFNIVDFSSKCNGQINIHVTPLEDLTAFKTQKEIYAGSISPPSSIEENKNLVANKTMQKSPQLISQDIEKEEDEEEPDSELLSRALKRKFTELDEITQRLRLRLSHVTNEDSDEGNDEVADEFERDINSLSIEDDFDMGNFEQESPHINIQRCDLLQTHQNLEIDCSAPSSLSGTENTSSQLNGTSNISLMMVPTQEEVTKEFDHTEESLSILDRQLLEGKQRIDTLLGKLSLISGDASNFTSRYVSGCSATNQSDYIDTEAILKDLDLHSRPNIHASTSFDNAMFERIYEVAEKGKGGSSSPSSGTSVISNLGELRAAPDGQGNLSEDKNKIKK